MFTKPRMKAALTGGITAIVVYLVIFRLFVYPAMVSGGKEAFSTYLSIAVAVSPVAMLIGSVVTGFMVRPHVESSWKTPFVTSPVAYAALPLTVGATRTAFFDGPVLIAVFFAGLSAMYLTSVVGVLIGMKLYPSAKLQPDGHSEPQ